MSLIGLLSRIEEKNLDLLYSTKLSMGKLELPVYVERKKRQLRHNLLDKFIELQPNTEAYKNSFYYWVAVWQSQSENG